MKVLEENLMMSILLTKIIEYHASLQLYVPETLKKWRKCGLIVVVFEYILLLLRTVEILLNLYLIVFFLYSYKSNNPTGKKKQMNQN
jgi:hypothetical protein